MFKMQLQDDPANPRSWQDINGPDGRPLTFETEADARAKLESIYPAQVKLEKYSGPKTTRVIAILQGTHDSRPMR
jgi:hypothetical protein